MRAALWLKVSLTISVIGATAPLRAQGVTRDQLRRECTDALSLQTVDSLGAALHRRTPNQSWSRMLAAWSPADYSALGDSVRALWDTLASGIDSTAAARMIRLLARQRTELSRLDSDHGFLVKEGATARWFEITTGDPGEPWLVNGAEPDSAVALTEGQTALPTVRAVCWTALLARKVADFGGRDARAQTRRVLAARARRWDNFERYGYSLTPLELLLNGWCGFCRGTLEPPRIQLIAVHVLPTYAVRDELGNRTALTTEVAGILFYNQARSFHVGFSYAYSLPAEERRESGWVVHVSKIGQLGITFRDNTYTRENASLLLSADLYRFIENWSGRIREERDAIAKGIQKLRGGQN